MTPLLHYGHAAQGRPAHLLTFAASPAAHNMPVRDLIGLYESGAHGPASPAETPQRKQTIPDDPLAPDGLPGPSLSRTSQVYTGVGSFVQSTSSLTHSTTLYDSTTTDTHETHDEITADVTDEFDDYHKNTKLRVGPLDSLIAKRTGSRQADAIEMKRLLPRKGTWNSADPTLSNAPSRWAEDIDSSGVPELPSSHNPVPATTIFARDAAPLSFPELDAHLSALSPPSFHSGRGKDGKPHMFPPVQLLAASGQTLDDLEKNTRVPHWWQNRNKIVGALASLALSITVGYLSLLCRYLFDNNIGLQCFSFVLQPTGSY